MNLNFCRSLAGCWILSAMCCLLLAVCGGRSGTGAPTQTSQPSTIPVPSTSMTLTSPAFTNGQTIPVRHTGDGENLSPELNWTDVPENTQSFALICSDPDAPGGTFIHWVIYNIPGTARTLPEGLPQNPVVLENAEQVRNDFGHFGYDGPKPPPGKPHRYFYRLYALDRRITSANGAVNAELLLNWMAGHVLATAELVGLYQR
ncbi:MAG: YbhB/YbcL family Raf kinase inhibitor-like protein [candidate division WOR-3 bacterium]